MEELDGFKATVRRGGILPRTHGSGLFQRGQTQVLTNVTLGPLGDVQMLDGVAEEETKIYASL